ncbi:MAG: hypothetical protein J5630_00470 [Bacteroidaceae bacterium]|nr:hypothetical protein [Bacteroidaceae bacterium]
MMSEAKEVYAEQMGLINNAISTKSNCPEMIEYMRSIPFRVGRTKLYKTEELFDVFDIEHPETFEQCMDTRVYRHEVKTGKQTCAPFELAARSLHDMGIRMAMEGFLNNYERNRVVGIMGGHALSRTSPVYRQAVDVSKRLTEDNYLMISGGGPGAMEATHLGAWMAGRTDAEVDEAIEILSVAPKFEDEGWLTQSFRVRERFPYVSNYESLAIPTWFYGHEPPCVFATQIAKLFENSIREDTLMTEAYGGLIFFEGSAGTLQEIFQEAVQDHYVSLGYPSPMLFVNSEFWTEQVPVFPFMQHMLENGRYKNLLINLVDTTDEIIYSIKEFKPGV